MYTDHSSTTLESGAGETFRTDQVWCVCVRACVRACVRMTVRDSVRAELQYSHSPAKYCAQLLSIISPALGTRTQPIFVLSDLTQFTECSWPINLVNRRQLTVACMDNKIT